MTNILNGQDKKQNDSFNFNFTNNNDQDKIEVNMFTSIRKDSMNFDEINKNLNYLNNKENSIQNNPNKENNEVFIPSPLNDKKPLRPKSKQLKLTPLDPKLYRINFEDFNQKKNILKENRLPRLSSAQIRKKDSLRKEQNSNTRKSVGATMKKMNQMKAKKNNIMHITLSKDKGRIVKKINNFPKEKEKSTTRTGLTDRIIQKELKNIDEDEQIVIDNFKPIKLNNLIQNDINNDNGQKIDQPKEKCIYCLSYIQNPVKLQCEHKICSSCLNELNILYSLQNKKTMKCPKCDAVISNNLLNKENRDFFENIDNRENVLTTIQKCSICHNTNVKYECLNCDMLLCLKCKTSHFSFPTNQNHKCIPYTENKSNDNSKCPIHQIEVEYFCVNDNIPICVKCVDVLHSEHIIKKLEEVNELYQVEIHSLLEKGKIYYEQIKSLIDNLDNAHKVLSNEKDFFIKKTKKLFNDMVNVLLTQQTIILNKINEFFNNKTSFIEDKKDKYSIVKNRFESYINVNDTLNQLDTSEKQVLQNIQFISNLKWINNSIFNNIPFDKLNTKISSYSYKVNSTYLNNPIKKISSSISKFTFFPISPKGLDSLNLFFKNSNIISQDMINTDLLITLPKLTKCKLLYQISRDGPSPELFHEKCNNKGATLTLIKTDTHIFGGFNSLNYTNKNEYQSSENNFIFSLSDGKIRKPMRCPIIKQMKKFAIKQSEDAYSPGFGLVDNSDLFIAFKQLNNSYSNLDNVYRCPKGYNPKTFLAGKENNWNILDIEIYQIEYLDDSEFYLLDDS